MGSKPAAHSPDGASVFPSVAILFCFLLLLLLLWKVIGWEVGGGGGGGGGDDG